MFDRIADLLPDRAGRVLGAVSGALALAGSLFLLAATAYGDWVEAAWALPCFAMAAVVWQVSDRMQRDLH